MYARGFEIANVSLERSLADQFKVDGNTLIPPFTVINGLGAEVANSIINEREIGPFTSKKNLSDRTKVNKKILKLLTDLNVLIGLDEDEQLSLF
jgi:DNA polymerase-3 subunit alpha (Gram-positive type)